MQRHLAGSNAEKIRVKSLAINTNTWNRIRYTIYQPGYDFIASIFHPFRKQSIEGLNLQPEDKVLIIGAGTGLDLEFFPQDAQITAIDLTPAMITKLKQRAASLGKEVHAETMDAHSLDFEDAQFDAIVMHLIVAVIPDPIQCLKEAERVLKPGGSFTIMDKFIESGSQPGILRKLMNPVTNFLFSNINRDIDELLTHTELEKESDIKLKSIFRLIRGRKPNRAPH